MKLIAKNEAWEWAKAVFLYRVLLTQNESTIDLRKKWTILFAPA